MTRPAAFRRVATAAVACAALVGPSPAFPQPLPPEATCVRPCVGPVAGTLVLAGGGHLGPEIWEDFVRRAGGADARIVVIPTATGGAEFPAAEARMDALRSAGAGHVTLLHTRDPRTADSEAFVEPLRGATGVWLQGGLASRLVDAYLGTRTHQAIGGVLDRGGVVGGSSAGASVLASYLVRGGSFDTDVIMAPGRERGFGFLHHVAVDQHLRARKRERDLLMVLERYPHLLGIGLDEGTALVVDGDLATVVGAGRVAVYDKGGWNSPVPFHWIDPGETYDLGSRKVVRTASK